MCIEAVCIQILSYLVRLYFTSETITVVGHSYAVAFVTVYLPLASYYVKAAEYKCIEFRTFRTFTTFDPKQILGTPLK